MIFLGFQTRSDIASQWLLQLHNTLHVSSFHHSVKKGSCLQLCESISLLFKECLQKCLLLACPYMIQCYILFDNHFEKAAWDISWYKYKFFNAQPTRNALTSDEDKDFNSKVETYIMNISISSHLEITQTFHCHTVMVLSQWSSKKTLADFVKSYCLKSNSCTITVSILRGSQMRRPIIHFNKIWRAPFSYAAVYSSLWSQTNISTKAICLANNRNDCKFQLYNFWKMFFHLWQILVFIFF